MLLELIIDANSPPVTQCKGSTFAFPFTFPYFRFGEGGGRTGALPLSLFCASKGWLVLALWGGVYLHTYMQVEGYEAPTQSMIGSGDDLGLGPKIQMGKKKKKQATRVTSSYRE